MYYIHYLTFTLNTHVAHRSKHTSDYHAHIPHKVHICKITYILFHIRLHIFLGKRSCSAHEIHMCRISLNIFDINFTDFT